MSITIYWDQYQSEYYINMNLFLLLFHFIFWYCTNVGIIKIKMNTHYSCRDPWRFAPFLWRVKYFYSWESTVAECDTLSSLQFYTPICYSPWISIWVANSKQWRVRRFYIFGISKWGVVFATRKCIERSCTI